MRKVSRGFSWLALASALFGAGIAPARAGSPGTQPTSGAETTAGEGEAERWALSGDFSGYFFFHGGDGDFLQPTIYADRGPLHLEARYNYEDRDTASLWGGWTFSFGKSVTVDLTPILGVVFGDTDGIAPGLETALAWKALEFSSQSEYLFDSNDRQSNYFYAWSEVSWRQPEWLRYGLVIQRTRVYQTPLDVQFGALAGFSFWKMELTAYYFNPTHSEDDFAVLTAGFEF